MSIRYGSGSHTQLPFRFSPMHACFGTNVMLDTEGVMLLAWRPSSGACITRMCLRCLAHCLKLSGSKATHAVQGQDTDMLMSMALSMLSALANHACQKHSALSTRTLCTRLQARPFAAAAAADLRNSFLELVCTMLRPASTWTIDSRIK